MAFKSSNTPNGTGARSTFPRLLLPIVISFLVIGASIDPLLCWGEGAVSKEYRIKAAFLLNFARFITWPDEAKQETQASLKFCVLGFDPLNSALDNLQSRTVRDRPITVERFDYSGQANTPGLKSCHLLFIASLDAKQFHEVEYALKGLPVLTVTDQKQGGMIDLVIKDNVVRFAIDRNKAEKAQIRISSHLLRLAMEVFE